jgi:hypothetical protein
MAMPRLQQLHEKYRDRGFEIVGLWLSGAVSDVDRTNGILTAKRSLVEKSVNYPNGYLGQLEEDEFVGRFGIVGAPHYWLFDRAGHLVSATLLLDQVERAVSELLDQNRREDTKADVDP